jgi:hypothetical protein
MSQPNNESSSGKQNPEGPSKKQSIPRGRRVILDGPKGGRISPEEARAAARYAKLHRTPTK